MKENTAPVAAAVPRDGHIMRGAGQVIPSLGPVVRSRQFQGLGHNAHHEPIWERDSSCPFCDATHLVRSACVFEISGKNKTVIGVVNLGSEANMLYRERFPKPRGLSDSRTIRPGRW